MTKESLIRELQKRVKAEGSAYKAAAALNSAPSHLSDVISGRREPGPKLLTALGLESVTIYRKKVTP